MTNKFLAIANEIKSRLVAAGFSVYIYPDEKIGQNFPIAIIEEGDKSFVAEPGGAFPVNQSIIIHIASNKMTERSKVMGDLEAAAWNALIDTTLLNGVLDNINPMTTELGISTEVIDQMNVAGYRGNISMRTLTINVIYYDCI